MMINRYRVYAGAAGIAVSLLGPGAHAIAAPSAPGGAIDTGPLVSSLATRSAPGLSGPVALTAYLTGGAESPYAPAPPSPPPAPPPGPPNNAPDDDDCLTCPGGAFDDGPPTGPSGIPGDLND